MKGCFKIQNYKLLSINAQKYNHFIFLNPSLLCSKNLKLYNSLMNAIFSTSVLKFKLFFVLFLLKYHGLTTMIQAKISLSFDFLLSFSYFFVRVNSRPVFFYFSTRKHISRGMGGGKGL